MTARIEIPNLDNLLQRYVAGESENKLAGEAGINRWTFRQRLLEADIEPRSQSEAEIAKWSRMSEAQRKAQVAAAHEATRGRKVTWSEKCKRATTVEEKGLHIVPVETELASQLRQAGHSITQQKAVGAYNIDVAINAPPIAVEIFGGGWHSSGRHRTRFHKRVEYLLDHGWSVVIVWLDARRYPFGPQCTQHIVSLAEQLGRDPAPRGEYRVILGNGESAPVADSHLNTPSDIARFSRG